MVFARSLRIKVVVIIKRQVFSARRLDWSDIGRTVEVVAIKWL